MANRGTKKKKTKYNDAIRKRNKIAKLERHLRRQKDPVAEKHLANLKKAA